MKSLRSTLIGALAALALTTAAQAADWPAKPVRVIVPFAPGSGTDIIMRYFAQPLGEALGQPFVIENRPGANGVIGTTAGARAAADGYTFFVISNSTVSAAPFVYKDVPYDVDKDVLPVAPFILAPSVMLAGPQFPADTFDQFLAYARGGTAKLAFAYANSVGLAVGNALRSKARLDMVEVAYKSSPQGITDVIAGQVPLMIVDTVAAGSFIKGKRVKVLAVTTAQRSPLYPDVPAMAERFPGIDGYAWVGIGAPAGTRAEIVDALNREIMRISRDKKTADHFANLGSTMQFLSAAEYKAFVSGQNRQWGVMLREAGVKPE